MGKRKRDAAHGEGFKNTNGITKARSSSKDIVDPISIQIVTGSYERILHGFIAKFQPAADKDDRKSATSQVAFSNTFLFAAHSSSIRCLALSQNKESKKCILATGGSDERINLYSVATSPISEHEAKPDLPSLAAGTILENPKNKELGSLMHHSRPMTKLYFPTPGKLFSAAEDNTIAITRTRDWTVLSSMKAPIPKPVGRPSGDTAAPGEVPAGVNDFAVHPSMKIMMSVGRGEKCMRLWNLVTGKKAGVLNFGKDLLRQVDEGRFGAGEGRKILWSAASETSVSQADLVVCFERAAALFGEDCEAKAILKPLPATKLHDIQDVPARARVIAASTEDGRVLFFSLDHGHRKTPDDLPVNTPFAQIGGPESGTDSTRVKAFTFVQITHSAWSLICITGSSDGCTRLWALRDVDLIEPVGETVEKEGGGTSTPKQIGTLLATHQSGNRITCLGAFVMDQFSPGSARNDSEEEEFAGFSSDTLEHD